MRIFLGFLIAAVALGGAVWLQGAAKLDHHGAMCLDFGVGTTYPCSSAGPGASFIPAYDAKASWQDTIAVVLAVAGVGAGVALVASSRPTR
jgi:hypothetical protein